jgi:hypothetical protein
VNSKGEKTILLTSEDCTKNGLRLRERERSR